MEKLEFENFLETGWMYGAYLYYDYKCYYVQCDYLEIGDKVHLTVFSFKGIKQKEDSLSICIHKDKRYYGFKLITDRDYNSCDEAKQFFFREKIFDGLSFWEIGDKFEWLEDDGPKIVIDDDSKDM